VFSASLACVGGLTMFTDESLEADAALAYWLWSFGTGETSGVQHAGYVYADTGSFLVEMIVTDSNMCQDTIEQMVSVFPVPLSAFEIVDNYESIQGQILLDNFTQSAVRYEWEFGNGDTSHMFAPVVRYQENGTYIVQLISWNDNNCPDTAYMEYTIEFQGLYVPTGFTPTSTDPTMRQFKPVGVNLESYQVTVINQRGNIVWSSNKLDQNGSPLEGWDGKVDGELMQPDTYMWSIKAKFLDGAIWTGNDVGDGNNNTYGKVVLIR
jgi:PKD repeat protein